MSALPRSDEEYRSLGVPEHVTDHRRSDIRVHVGPMRDVSVAFVVEPLEQPDRSAVVAHLTTMLVKGRALRRRFD